jgi:type IV secretory pathway TrbD component
MEGVPPLRWADRYDGYALVLAASVVAVVLVAGASVWLAIVLGAVITPVGAYLLRRRAGVPRTTLWQRRRRGRHVGPG